MLGLKYILNYGPSNPFCFPQKVSSEHLSCASWEKNSIEFAYIKRLDNNIFQRGNAHHE